MIRAFEFFIAVRHLRARRKEAVISVITVIAVAGVAAGVMALVIGLAINNGFRNTLQRTLLGATAHINLIEKEPGPGIENWRDLVERISKVPHVIAASPVLYGEVYLSGPVAGKGAVIKGIDTAGELRVSETLRHLQQGRIEFLNSPDVCTIVLGSRLRRDLGMNLSSYVTVLTDRGAMTPFGYEPLKSRCQVVGTFESGFYQFDDSWAFLSIPNAQKLLALPGIVNSIEVRLDDIYRAPEAAREIDRIAGPTYVSTTWEDQNRQLLNALRMEEAVTVVTIGLIQLVAALNILAVLVMIVMEKYRSIGILMSLGARQAQIRNIFLAEGLAIGFTGTLLGLIAGYTLCYLAGTYHWIRLDEEVYALSFVPFEPRVADGIWISLTAILVSFLATLYPARKATRITPVEVLRYE